MLIWENNYAQSRKMWTVKDRIDLELYYLYVFGSIILPNIRNLSNAIPDKISIAGFGYTKKTGA